MALALAFAVALAALLVLGTLTRPAYGPDRPVPSPGPLSSLGRRPSLPLDLDRSGV